MADTCCPINAGSIAFDISALTQHARAAGGSTRAQEPRQDGGRKRGGASEQARRPGAARAGGALALAAQRHLTGMQPARGGPGKSRVCW